MKNNHIIISVISLLLMVMVAYFLRNNNASKTVVIVVSDESSKSHMTIYGYPSLTTPNLNNLKKNNELIILTKAITNHSKSAQDTQALLATTTNTKETIFKPFARQGFDIYTFGNINITKIDTNFNPITEQTDLISQLAA